MTQAGLCSVFHLNSKQIWLDYGTKALLIFGYVCNTVEIGKKLRTGSFSWLWILWASSTFIYSMCVGLSGIVICIIVVLLNYKTGTTGFTALQIQTLPLLHQGHCKSSDRHVAKKKKKETSLCLPVAGLQGLCWVPVSNFSVLGVWNEILKLMDLAEPLQLPQISLATHQN